MVQFGEIIPQNVKEYWAHEAYDFTRWLEEDINTEGTSQFEEALGLDLEIVDREKNVGRYKLDLLGKEIDGERTIVIENQLMPSDHDHLGKIIAYASGVDADIIVWISPQFNDEHVEALRWLNSKTELGTDFFGLELHVWKINDSLPAIEFDAVAEPSEWQRRVKMASRDISPMKKLQERFWTGFRDALRERDTRLRAREPRPQNNYTNPIGRKGFVLQFAMNTQIERLYTTLIIRDDFEAFQQLQQDQQAIEGQIDAELEWIPPEETLAEKERCKIRAFRQANIEEEEHWDEYIEWLVKIGEQFYAVFYERIQNL